MFSKISNKLSLLGAYLSSILILSLAILVISEIFSRHFFDTSTMIADEYSGYLYLSAIFLGLAYTLQENAHIRINIITSKLSTKSNKIIDVIAGLTSISVLFFILYRTILFTYESYDMEMLSERVSETPLYLTQIVMPIGIILFIIAMIAFTLQKMKK